MLDPQFTELLRDLGPTIFALNWIAGVSFLTLASLALLRHAAVKGEVSNPMALVLGIAFGGATWARRDPMLFLLIGLARIALLISALATVVYFAFVPL